MGTYTAAGWPADLEAALKKNKSLPYSKYFSLGTIANGRPAVRTVVFRGFNGDTGITFCTDSRYSCATQHLPAPPDYPVPALLTKL